MKKRTIFQTQTVDFTTGEIKEMTVVRASHNNETFSFVRETDGLDWIYELSGAEIKILIFLISCEKPTPSSSEFTLTHLAVLSKFDIEELLNKLDCSKRYLNKLLMDLSRKKLILKLDSKTFVVNPKTFYKGPSKEVFKRILEFERLCKEGSSTIRGIGVGSSGPK